MSGGGSVRTFQARLTSVVTDFKKDNFNKIRPKLIYPINRLFQSDCFNPMSMVASTQLQYLNTEERI